MIGNYFERLILVGSNGFIGKEIIKDMSNSLEILSLDLPDFDVSNYNDYNSFLSTASDFASKGNTVVINAAGIMNAELSKKNPDVFYKVNGLSVKPLYQWSCDIGASNFIQLSSETVYGSGDTLFDEESPRCPIHPYGISKMLGEILLTESHNEKNVPATILRLPVIVGRNQNTPNPVELFSKEAKELGRVTIFNDGLHRRKFLYVGDFTQSLAAIIKNQKQLNGLSIYNIGGQVTNMVDLAKLVTKFNPTSEIIFKKSNTQAFSLVSSHTKFNAEYKFSANTSLEEMISMF